MSKEANNTMKDLTSLEDFKGWENLSDEGDFFSEIEDTKETGIDVEDVLKDVAKDEDDDTTDDKDSKKGDDTPEDDDLFSSEEIEESRANEDIDEDDEEEEDGDEPDTSTSPNVATVNLLKEKGLIDFELEEDEELTEEKAEELIEDKFDEAIEKRVEELFENVPDIVKQINKYAINGGDLNQFFGALAKNNTSQISDNLDLAEESNQELVVREMLKAEDNDDEYIDTQLEFLKESGKLKMFAEKKFNKWKTNKAKEQEQLVKQQEENSRKQKEALRKAKQEVSSFLSDNEGIGGLQFTKDDKKSLPSYMNDKSVKLQNGATISQLQKELFYDLPQNKEAFMQLAVLMKNRNEDGTFNFESIIKNTETNVVKKVKENVRRSKQNIPTKSKNKKQYSKRSLADFFN
jgi:hypothetical protein